MRGLPFPQDAAFERETSYEYGTPASNFDDIPIDPALADPPIDPALQAYTVKPDPDQVRIRLNLQHATRLQAVTVAPLPLIDRVASRPFHRILNRVTSLFACSYVHYFQIAIPLSFAPDAPHHIREYSQGPQGDPFAQPPPPDYFPPVSEAVLNTKPLKKKRRVRREPNCGFCGGNDKKNTIGDPEEMVSCDECGRSGQFSWRLCLPGVWLTCLRPSDVHGSWLCCRSCAFLPMEMR